MLSKTKIEKVLVLIFISQYLFSQSFVFTKSNVPKQVSFANVNFSFTEQTHEMFTQEVLAFGRNPELRTQNLKEFSFINPIVENILIKNEIPVDFKFLSIFPSYQNTLQSNLMLESGVLWCLDFKKSQSLGLNVNNEIDDRKHLSIATAAASRNILKSHASTDNWGSSLFSQLVAPEVLSTFGIERRWVDNNITINSSQFATLIKFLAYKHVLDQDFSAFKPVDKRQYFEYQKASDKPLQKVAEDFKIDPKELIEANAWLKSGTVPESYTVYLPVNMVRYNELKNMGDIVKPKSVKKELDAGFPILKSSPGLAQGHGGVFYTINKLKGVLTESCDDFVNLSYKGDLHTKLFLKYNDLTTKVPLIVGQVYYLEAKNNKAEVPFHVVRNQETLWDVSHRYGVKLDALLKYNIMPANAPLQLGRVVYLQQKRPENKPIEFMDVPKEEKAKSNVDEIFEVAQVQAPKSVPQVEEVSVAVQNDPEIDRKKEQEELPIVKVENKVIPKTTPIKLESNEGTFSERVGKAVMQDIHNGKYFVHDVKQGETLYRISINYNVPLDQLYTLNNLRTNIIEIGDKIIVKKY